MITSITWSPMYLQKMNLPHPKLVQEFPLTTTRAPTLNTFRDPQCCQEDGTFKHISGVPRAQFPSVMRWSTVDATSLGLHKSRPDVEML